MKHLLWTAVLALLLHTNAWAAPALTRLDIERANGSRVVFRVEYVNTPEAMKKGLMYRTKLAKDRGMLFDFGESTHIAMWMKNTLIPLDMLFINERGVITQIAANAVPEDETPIEAHKPIRYVLEIKGGTAYSAKIRVGDKVLGLPEPELPAKEKP